MTKIMYSLMIALVIGIGYTLYEAMTYFDEIEAECTAKSGVLVKSYRGYACVPGLK